MLFGMFLIIGAAVALFLGAKALGGPNANKNVKRRMEMLKERHGEGGSDDQDCPKQHHSWSRLCWRRGRQA